MSWQSWENVPPKPAHVRVCTYAHTVQHKTNLNIFNNINNNIHSNPKSGDAQCPVIQNNWHLVCGDNILHTWGYDVDISPINYY